MAKILSENSVLSDAYKALEISGYTPEQLLEYERFEWKEEEIQTRIDDARLEGERQGRAEERAKALAEKIEMAKKMLRDGLSIDIISKYSDLSIHEIETLTSD